MKNSKSNSTNLQCFEKIEISEPAIKNKRFITKIIIFDLNKQKSEFNLFAKYDNLLLYESQPLIQMASVMPLLNYGLFTKKIKLNFRITKADYSLIRDLLEIFSKDILVNKFLRIKNPYIIQQFEIANSIPNWKTFFQTNIVHTGLDVDKMIKEDLNKNSCGLLSSGGKESLLTYGILKEIGAKVHPLYVNESGGHWRTALPAYRKFIEIDPNTERVWTNVDRLYTFMLDHMRIIRKDHRKIWFDTYPIRLSIFPFYVFLLLPIFIKRNIGNILIGSEFDDPRTAPYFKGIKHFFGIYDQSQDFDLRMERWFSKRIKGLRQWSLVRSISGLIVERILTSRYPKLAQLQRSCHSCHFHNKKLVPCGKCSKCQGILLFLLANKVNPKLLGYTKENVALLPNLLVKGNLKLDEDEKNFALFLSKMSPNLKNNKINHIETIHIHRNASDLELIPIHFRLSIINILKKYTKGFSIIKKETWINSPQPKYIKEF